MKIIKKFLTFIFILTLLVLPYFVFAESALSNLEKVGSDNGPYATASETSLAETVGLIINMFLSLMGVIFVGLMVYAGYNWMVARGEEEKVTIAKDTIKRAIIGLVITVSSYAIWNFIFSNFINIQ